MKMKLMPIAHQDVDVYWPLAEKYIKLAAILNTVEEFRALCVENEQALLYIIHSDCIVCGAMIVHVDGEALHCAAIAGKLPRGWVDDVHAHLVKLAKRLGLPRMTMNGRRGWVRFLKHLGWKYESEKLFYEVTPWAA
jgi:hypothetical protein